MNDQTVLGVQLRARGNASGIPFGVDAHDCEAFKVFRTVTITVFTKTIWMLVD